MNENAASIAARFGVSRPAADGRFRINCPVHGGDGFNLAIWDGRRGRIAVVCFTQNCSREDVLRALGVESQREAVSVPDDNERWRIATYFTPEGEARPRYRRDTPSGKRVWGVKGHSPKDGILIKLWPGENSNGRELVVLVEGEKAAMAVQAAGFTAASWYGGAKQSIYAEYAPLEGRHIIAWPDDDAEGRLAMLDASERALTAGAVSLRWVTTPGGESRDDAADITASEIADALRAAGRDGPDPEKITAAAAIVANDDSTSDDSASSESHTDDNRKAKTEGALLRGKAVDRLCEQRQWLRLTSEYGSESDTWWYSNEGGWIPAPEGEIRSLARGAYAEVSNVEPDIVTTQTLSQVVNALKDRAMPDSYHISPRPPLNRAWRIWPAPWEEQSGVRCLTHRLFVDAGGALHATELTADVFDPTPARPFSWSPEQSRVAPRFREMIDRALPDGVPARWIEGHIGRAILGGVPPGAHADLEGALVLSGEGGSGKGTILEVVGRLCGGAAELTITGLGGRFMAGRLINSPVVVVRDMAALGKRPTDVERQGLSILKSLIVNEPIEAEQKNVKTSAFSDLAWRGTVWVATNHPPRFASGGEDLSAWERRLLPVEFENVVAAKDRVTDFAAQIVIEEGDAIAARCIDAWQEMLRGETPALPEHVAKNRRAILVAGILPAQRFAMLFEPQRHHFIANSELWNWAAEWARDEAVTQWLDDDVLTKSAQRSINDALREMGAEAGKANRGAIRGKYHVALRADSGLDALSAPRSPQDGAEAPEALTSPHTLANAPELAEGHLESNMDGSIKARCHLCKVAGTFDESDDARAKGEQWLIDHVQRRHRK